MNPTTKILHLPVLLALGVAASLSVTGCAAPADGGDDEGTPEPEVAASAQPDASTNEPAAAGEGATGKVAQGLSGVPCGYSTNGQSGFRYGRWFNCYPYAWELVHVDKVAWYDSIVCVAPQGIQGLGQANGRVADVRGAYHLRYGC